VTYEFDKARSITIYPTGSISALDNNMRPTGVHLKLDDVKYLRDEIIKVVNFGMGYKSDVPVAGKGTKGMMITINEQPVSVMISILWNPGMGIQMPAQISNLINDVNRLMP
jgi:hypothetical protein